MYLREVLAILRNGWWLLVAGVVAGAAVALTVSLAQTPLYTSTTQLFVSTTGSTSLSDAYQGSQLSQQRVTSYTELLTGEQLAGRVVDRLGLDMSPSELSSEITASTTAGTVLIDVAVTDPSPVRAQQVAEAVGAEFSRTVTRLEGPASGEPSPVRVSVTEEPKVPTEPSSPQTLRNIGIGMLVGLLAGAAVTIGRDRMDRTVKDVAQASDLTRAPVIGTVTRDPALSREPLLERSTSSRAAEDYRQLRTNLRFLRIDRRPKVIMISSAAPEEGKTTLAVNLALALTDAGQRVTIVEADLRRPKITRFLDLADDPGLTDVLAGSASVEQVIQRYDDSDLMVVGGGQEPPNPGELLASTQMKAVVDELREENDYVLVDAPPLLPVADSSGLAVHCDGALLVVRYGATRKEEVHQAAATLERVGTEVLGVVLNIVPPKAEVTALYRYSYGRHADGARTASQARAAVLGPPRGHGVLARGVDTE